MMQLPFRHCPVRPVSKATKAQARESIAEATRLWPTTGGRGLLRDLALSTPPQHPLIGMAIRNRWTFGMVAPSEWRTSGVSDPRNGGPKSACDIFRPSLPVHSHLLPGFNQSWKWMNRSIRHRLASKTQGLMMQLPGFLTTMIAAVINLGAHTIHNSSNTTTH